MSGQRQLFLSLFAILLAACTVPAVPGERPAAVQATLPAPTAMETRPRPATALPASSSCTPTPDDGISPTYKANMPVRIIVGQGHILHGTLRSSHDCSPIAGAVVEAWPEYAGQGHPDEYRATIVTDAEGSFWFECNPPEHIHLRISVPGYKTIGNNSYHPAGQAEGRMDIVLAPEEK